MNPTTEYDIDGNVVRFYVIRDLETGQVVPDRFPYDEAQAEKTRYNDATIVRFDDLTDAEKATVLDPTR